jgi:hypothetical protein
MSTVQTAGCHSAGVEAFRYPAERLVDSSGEELLGYAMAA